MRTRAIHSPSSMPARWSLDLPSLLTARGRHAAQALQHRGGRFAGGRRFVIGALPRTYELRHVTRRGHEPLDGRDQAIVLVGRADRGAHEARIAGSSSQGFTMMPSRTSAFAASVLAMPVSRKTKFANDGASGEYSGSSAHAARARALRDDLAH